MLLHYPCCNFSLRNPDFLGDPGNFFPIFTNIRYMNVRNSVAVKKRPIKTKKRPPHQNRDDLIGHYRSYVRHIVKMLIRTMGLPQKLQEELLAAGYLGLVEAADKFDIKRGNEFPTYAFLRIRGSIVDAIRKNSEISGRAYKTAKALMAAYSMRNTQLQDATPAETEMPNSISGIMDYAAKSSLIFRLSLGEAQDEVKELASPLPNPEERLSAQQSQQLFQSIIASLPEKERFIVEQYYFKDLTFEDIGKLNGGFGKSWASRIHARAINIIRDRYYEALDQ